MTTVKYIGSTNAQVKYCDGDDPRNSLTKGESYTVQAEDEHNWFTKIKLVDVDGWFNSICFEETNS